jgi:hypothetical protein
MKYLTPDLLARFRSGEIETAEWEQAGEAYDNQLKSRGPRWVGTVTEARGTYSPNGHVLYRVRVPMDPEPLFLLVREEEVADPHVLTEFAEEVHHLMDAPQARERFRGRCLEYLRERGDDNGRLPPMDLLRDDDSPPLTLPEKYALLAALHTAIHGGEEEFDPVGKPEGLTWEEFAHRDLEGYKNAVRWAALVNRVKEWLGPEKADDIQRWLEAVRADLQQQ